VNPDVKAKWLEALRSGDYTQGTGKLAGPDVENGEPSYCCLGVLCDVAVKEGVIPPPYQEMMPQGRYYLRFVDEGGYLPTLVMKWAELASVNPTIGRNGDYRRQVSSWNDSGTPFSEIADMIEASL
jgi:hypothetical protein